MNTLFYLIPARSNCRLNDETRLQYWIRRIRSGRRQAPIGGVKIMYQHCDMLNAHGFQAMPVHLDNSIVDWFPHRSKAISLAEALEIATWSDILICPENIPTKAELFPCANKVVFIQNWALTERVTGLGKKYEDFGFTSILSCSNYLRKYMADKSSLPSRVVINGIDLEVFHNRAQPAKPNRVLMLNRRNIADARQAIDLLAPDIRRKAEYIILEDHYTQSEIAKQFRRADIFLAIGYPEGFALPPLEAMASGCAVVGFTGGGGLEHMIDGQSALVAEDGNIQELAQCLQQVLVNGALKKKLRENGLRKAQEFSLANMEQQLLNFVQRMVTA